MAELALGIATGVLAGLASSILFWWWQARILRPRITLCPELGRYRPNSTPAFNYQLKVVNSGRRAMVNLRAAVRILMPDLVRKGSVEVLQLETQERPWLDAKAQVRYNVRPNTIADDTRARYRQFFSAAINGAFEAGEDVDLLDFLAQSPRASISVIVSAEDSFSGARRFMKQTYGPANMGTGRHLPGTSCQCTGQLEDAQAHSPEEVEAPPAGVGSKGK